MEKLTDVQLALLGDRAAQERITERGELLPCPFCGSSNVLFLEQEDIEPKGTKFGFIFCTKCHFSSDTYSKQNALHKWNTRAPILTPEQIKRLEEDQ